MVITSSVSSHPTVDTTLKLYCVAAPRQVTFTDMIEDDGIDNPFRPGGGLSREADIIVQMIKAGKQITPTSPTREDIRELEEDLKRRQQKEHPVEPEKSIAHTTSDVSHAESNGVSTRTGDRMANSGTSNANGNNNRPTSKPSSPKGSNGKSSVSPVENNVRDKVSLKKTDKRACCAIQ